MSEYLTHAVATRYVQTFHAPTGRRWSQSQSNAMSSV